MSNYCKKKKNEITIRSEVVKKVFLHKPVYVSSVRHRCQIFGPRDLSYYFVICLLSPLRTVVRIQIIVCTSDIKHKNLKKILLSRKPKIKLGKTIRQK